MNDYINTSERGEQAMIKDSGDRREYATGAVRDMAEGKGRCDLLPLDVADTLLGSPGVLHWISEFQATDNEGFLMRALRTFWEEYGWDAPTVLLEVSKHMEEGAKKYGERNWEKGLPVSCFIDSAVRHYLKLLRGDDDEPHDRAFCWNMLCCLWTIRHKSENGCEQCANT